MASRHFDVVVVGSGAAALVAALSARIVGARVIVLERSPLLGGTSAISGGQIWSPLNDLMAEAGAADERSDAQSYLAQVTLGEVEPGRLSTYLDRSPTLLQSLRAWTKLDFFRVDRPDYHPRLVGARDGRSFEPLPFDASCLGPWLSRVRTSPLRQPVTSQEARQGLDASVIAARRAADIRTQGAALVAGLVRACLDRGVMCRVNARVTELVQESNAMAGCRLSSTDGPDEHVFGGAVVLASGGFEWNPRLKAAFLPLADQAPTSPPWNEGDGLVMGMKAGAGVAHMTEAWWTAAVHVPGETWDGQPLFRNIVRELALPGSIMINADGRRFVNEASSYHELGKAFEYFEPGRGFHPNKTAWLVFDARFKERYPVVNVPADAPAPGWFKQGETLADLAETLALKPDALEATVRRFNESASVGMDPDFQRGADRHGRGYGDPRQEPNPCVAPLVQAPFFAIPILPGNNGTKGGLTTDHDGRVVRFDGRVIAGLFACGNVAASIMGPGYPGTGGSLGPAMTEALFAGRVAATSAKEKL